MWPFRRKSRRKRSRANTTEFEDTRTSPTDFEESRGRITEQELADSTLPAVAALLQQSTKKQRTSPNKLQRRARTYSFSPGRNDAIGVDRQGKAKRGALSSGYRNAGDDREKEGRGVSVMDEHVFQRAPTLHNKRDGDHLPRKKSSKKRRKNDPQREAEIKAMSNIMPVRPATEDWTAGRPMKKETRRVRTGFSFGFKGAARQEWEKQNRSSDISLPVPESIHSSMSSDSEHISFRVSALEALAPRPTLRYTTHPRPSAGTGNGSGGLFRRSSQQQRKLSAPIPEATLKAHKRIDDFADDLSASELRELMERDKRRRERRRQREQEKVEQKLARRAEKQRDAAAEAVAEGRESPPNLERGVLGREAVGLGIDPASVVVTSSRRRQTHESPIQTDKHSGDDGEATEGDLQATPLTSFHRMNSIPLQTPPPQVGPEEQQVPPLNSPRSRSSFLRYGLSRSKSPQESEVKTEHSEPPQKGSETSSSKGPLSWTSFFRWGGKNKRGSAEPSSFSNTSRDSMQTMPLPTPPVSFVPRRLSSGVPKRTMSRFREDLPELPLSPPDSRLQSPEADPIPPTITEASPDPHVDKESMTYDPPAPNARYDTPASEQRSMEAMRQTPSTFGHPDEPGVSPEPQSMSLASIDSEASWLSGRLSKKRKSSGILQTSPYMQLPRRTSESDNDRPVEQDNTNEDISIADDDYLSRFTLPSAERRNRKSAGDARPSSDGEEEVHWGSVGGHPMVVHTHVADRMKSREGLLKSFGEEAEGEGLPASPTAGSPVSDIGDEGEGEDLQRATSINLRKGHVRHISAGSARLLSISPRSSVDARQASLSPKSET